MNSFTSRRSFLTSVAALPFALRSLAESVVAGPRWIFLGTDAGEGVYRSSWNGATGELGKIELAVATDRPDFFAVSGEHSGRPVLYTVNSMGDGKGGVSSYHIDPATGALRFANRVSSQGDGPCFISLDDWGDSAFVANYAGGSIAAFRIAANGALRPANSTLHCRNNAACGTLGPVKDRQDTSHLHCATIAPDNDFVLSCDLGNDAIEVVPIEPDAEKVMGRAVRVAARPGSGPRHLAFHPQRKWLYCIHELDCTIAIYDWSVRKGQPSLVMRAGSVISTLAPGESKVGSTGCEIIVSADGRFVYACTRGVDEITVYSTDLDTGVLTERQRLHCGGKIPRLITFDPSQRWLISCNQGAPGSVTVFAHDPATGRLRDKPKTFAANTPMCAAWV